MVPRQWKVVQTAREKFSCRACEKITQPPTPFHVTPRGLFGPSFLAMLLFEKFGAHQPLNHQRDRYDREGMDLSPPGRSGRRLYRCADAALPADQAACPSRRATA